MTPHVEVGRIFADLVQLRRFLEDKIEPMFRSKINESFKETCRTGTQRRFMRLHDRDDDNYPDPTSLNDDGTCYKIYENDADIYSFDNVFNTWLWPKSFWSNDFTLHIGNSRSVGGRSYDNGIGIEFTFGLRGGFKEVACSINCQGPEIFKQTWPPWDNYYDYSRTYTFWMFGGVHIELALRESGRGLVATVRQTNLSSFGGLTDMPGISRSAFTKNTQSYVEAELAKMASTMASDLSGVLNRQIPNMLENMGRAGSLRWLFGDAFSGGDRTTFQRVRAVADGEQLYASITVARDWLESPPLPDLTVPDGSGSVGLVLSYAFINRLLSEWIGGRSVMSVADELKELMPNGTILDHQSCRSGWSLDFRLMCPEMIFSATLTSPSRTFVTFSIRSL